MREQTTLAAVGNATVQAAVTETWNTTPLEEWLRNGTQITYSNGINMHKI